MEGQKQTADSSPDPPILYSYTLQDLKNNISGKPIKILDYDYLWDNMVTPFTSDEDDNVSKVKKMRKDHSYHLLFGDDNFPMDQGQMPNSVQNVIHHILEPPQPLAPFVEDDPQAAQDAFLPPVPFEVEVGNNDNNEEEAVVDENEENAPAANENNNNNNNENENEDDEEPNEPNIHDDVWDALISDDLRQINDLYRKKTLNVDEYLE